MKIVSNYFGLLGLHNSCIHHVSRHPKWRYPSLRKGKACHILKPSPSIRTHMYSKFISPSSNSHLYFVKNWTTVIMLHLLIVISQEIKKLNTFHQFWNFSTLPLTWPTYCQQYWLDCDEEQHYSLNFCVSLFICYEVKHRTNNVLTLIVEPMHHGRDFMVPLR